MNRKKIKSTLLKALKEAGKVLARSLHERRIVERKTELSLVTETDKKAEKIIVETILKAFPNHSLLTEESPPSGTSASRWIIDPLDGTTNFAHTYPVACISIAFEKEGIIEAAGILDPFRKELFFAEKGGGAFLNGKRIQVSQTHAVSEALLATGFPYDRKVRCDEYLSIFRAMLLLCQGIRRAGAAALDLCYVACGRYDAYWEVNLQPWDKAAGMLILEEAGGKTTDFYGGKLTLQHTQNLASNTLLHDEMLKILKPFQHIK